jgi:glutamate-1-semialdehyde 2,1-aminomutase
MRFDRSAQLGARLEDLVPGGAHTYAKGPDQFPAQMAPLIARGSGAHVWDVDGNRFIEYGSGLRAVTLGHAHPQVVERVAETLPLGTNFSRPSALELEAAELVLGLVPGADQIKFTKNGSDATTAAVRLARAVTGRQLIGICGDQPFFSVDDWFIGRTPMPAGIPEVIQNLTVTFPYGDLAALAQLFAEHPGQISALIMQATTGADPAAGYLESVRALCDREGCLLIFDEMITGFRWANGGAQTLYGVQPDLSTFGKAMGNGFAVSALLGKREFMERGGLHTAQERVFLLSTTHGAESVGLAAACAVAQVYAQQPVIEDLERIGRTLAAGVDEVTARAGVSDHVQVIGRPSNLVFVTRDREGAPSQPFRTLFMQELIRNGVLGPSFVVSAALTDEDIDHTVAAAAAASEVYAKALDDGADRFLEGRPVKPTLRPFA